MFDSMKNGDVDLPDPLGGFGKFVPPHAGAKVPPKPPEAEVEAVAKVDAEVEAEADAEAVAKVETEADSGTKFESTPSVEGTAEVAPEAETVPPVEITVEAEDLASIIFRARKSPEEVAALMSSKKEYLTTPVGKAPKEKYIRVRAGEEWDYRLHAYLMLPDSFGGGRRDFLLIHPDLEDFVESKRQLRKATKVFGLAFIVDAQGSPAFWVLNLSDTSDWGKSARVIVEELKEDWGMVCSDDGCYVLERPADDLGEPAWPDESPQEWLKKAFKDRIIDSEDHPEIKKLLGKK
jgi:hypothetical protein